ncbi:MAG: sigma 54-interacting transcriptional regulator, partial [Verrucomicrobiota bacterium]
GAGKSQLARRIYELRKARNRVSGRFVEANCATLRGDAAMSTLFGHRKGAFTGAMADRDGLLSAADGGILFLDEVGELGSDEQAMLLRAVEEQRFMPLGSDRETQSRFQLICGTNRDLRQDVAAGKFRYDLLARINLWTFELPGLRNRREDIEPNLDYELRQYASESGKRIRFNKEARTKFLAFADSEAADWAGNFRDLNAAVTRMATLAHGGRINEALVEEEQARLEASWSRIEENADEVLLRDVLGQSDLETIDRFDRPQLADVIRVCRASDSLSAAGRILFDVSRTRKKQANDADRLRKYLTRFGLDWSSVRHDILHMDNASCGPSS